MSRTGEGQNCRRQLGKTESILNFANANYKSIIYINNVEELGLFYYKKENSTLEEDFFVRTQNELVPVEANLNSNGSKSLSTLMKIKAMKI